MTKEEILRLKDKGYITREEAKMLRRDRHIGRYVSLTRSPWKVEGFWKAFARDFRKYVCHHRRETHSMKTGKPLKTQVSATQLKASGQYYNVPPNELIFLSTKEHAAVHSLGSSLGRRTKKSNKKKAKVARGVAQVRGQTSKSFTRRITRKSLRSFRNIYYKVARSVAIEEAIKLGAPLISKHTRCPDGEMRVLIAKEQDLSLAALRCLRALKEAHIASESNGWWAVDDKRLCNSLSDSSNLSNDLIKRLNAEKLLSTDAGRKLLDTSFNPEERETDHEKYIESLPKVASQKKLSLTQDEDGNFLWD